MSGNENPAPGPGKDDAGDPQQHQNNSGNDDLSGGPGEVQPEIPSVIQLTEAEEARRLELLDAAVGYTQDPGWRVIPLCWVTAEGRCGYSGHRECAGPGKQPLLKEWPAIATSDPVIAAKWWTPPHQWTPQGGAFDAWYPLANIGLVLGEESGAFVLDVDPDHGGLDRLEQLQREHGQLPVTRMHVTGGDGLHYFWQYPGFRVRNRKPWGKDAGLDIKGSNGYVVLPPSISHKGPYTVSQAMSQAPIAEAPEWILGPLRDADKAQKGDRVKGAEVLPSRLVSSYVESALKGEHFVLGDMAPGGRNDQLNTSAFTLGTLGAHGLVAEDEARALLQDACYANGLIQADGLMSFNQTFSSGWNAGLHHPRDLSAVGENLTTGQLFAQTEIGLGERFVVYFGDRVYYVNSWDAWMFFRNGAWQRKEGRGGRNQARVLAQEMIKNLLPEEDRYYDSTPPGQNQPSDQSRFEAWRKKQETTAKVGATIEVASGMPIIRRDPAQFDDHPMLLSCINGTIDLETGRLTDHDPDLMVSMQCPVPYDPSAGCPGWHAFLDRVQPDEEMQAFLQRAVLLSATGLNPEQAFFLHYGLGANGKSVFHSVIQMVLGNYAQTVPVEALLSTATDRIPNDVARMEGKRYLLAPEPKSGKFLDLSRLKQLTGGDSIAARFMRGEYFEFRMVGKIHMTTNHLPRISEIRDMAAWRRIHVIPWNVMIPPEERDEKLAKRLFDTEGPGILAWIVRAGMDWGSNGFLRPPGAAQTAKAEYQKAEDLTGQWIEESCIDRHEEVDRLLAGGSRSALYESFRLWLRDGGYPVITRKDFFAELRNRGYREVKVHGERGFAGLAARGFGAQEDL